MHFGSTRSPYNNMNAPTTQEFFKNPVKIEHAPRGGSVYPPDTCDMDGDWAFATDPYMVAKKNTMPNVTSQAVSVYDTLFYKSVDADVADAGPSNPLVYSQYNVDADGYDVTLRCKADCVVCAGIGEGKIIVPEADADGEEVAV
jgi:hypothetical protein